MSSQSSTAPDLNALFGSAVSSGGASQSVLENIGVEDLGQVIQSGFGVSADQIAATEVVLVGALIDDSGSIRMAGNSEAMREGHNLLIDSLSGAGQKTRDGILMMTRYLNEVQPLFPFVPIGQATKMTTKNYNPNGGTPLYDQTAIFLATMLAKWQEFMDSGIPCRTISVIVTDGHDEHSVRQDLQSTGDLVRDMLMRESHIIAGMGLADHRGPDFFKKIFSDMGILDEWILTPNSDPKEIRKAFHTVSQSAVRASQGAAAFSQMGGFGSI